MKDDKKKKEVALFRLAVLGDLVHTELRRGAQRRALVKKAQEVWQCPDGRSRRIRAKTIESWLYAYRKHGIDGLLPRKRKDKGACRVIPQGLQDLVLDMKREDPGRTAAMIVRELRGAGLMRPGQFSASAVTRLLKRHEYNQRPHAGISGRTPLSVFEEDAEQVRFVEDPRKLESAFEASLERTVRNDSTCSLGGKTYEVPPHLRRRRISLRYKLLRPESVWIEDGNVQVPLREVDPVANASRSRRPAAPEPESQRPHTGLNAVEGLIDRTLRPGNNRHEDDDPIGGSPCARS